MDAWTNRTSAHHALEDHWVGTTEFHLMTRVPSSNYDHDHDTNHETIVTDPNQ